MAELFNNVNTDGSQGVSTLTDDNLGTTNWVEDIHNSSWNDEVNDHVSSIKVNKGYQLCGYADANLSGYKYCWNGEVEENSLSHLYDDISSFTFRKDCSNALWAWDSTCMDGPENNVVGTTTDNLCSNKDSTCYLNRLQSENSLSMPLRFECLSDPQESPAAVACRTYSTTVSDAQSADTVRWMNPIGATDETLTKQQRVCSRYGIDSRPKTFAACFTGSTSYYGRMMSNCIAKVASDPNAVDISRCNQVCKNQKDYPNSGPQCDEYMRERCKGIITRGEHKNRPDDTILRTNSLTDAGKICGCYVSQYDADYYAPLHDLTNAFYAISPACYPTCSLVEAYSHTFNTSRDCPANIQTCINQFTSTGGQYFQDVQAMINCTQTITNGGNNPTVMSAASTGTSYTSTSTPSNNGQFPWKWIIGGIVACIVTVIGLLAGFFLMQSASTSTVTNSNTNTIVNNLNLNAATA